VKVPGLASWTLSRVLRRLSGDWQNKYGHGLALAETFVERERFSGGCYRAANWMRIGSTCGRSRQDRDRKIQVPIKEVYLYALEKNVQKELGR
jgi:hypothetical protein